jgi:Leucine-rich repeat (LRR) protein
MSTPSDIQSYASLLKESLNTPAKRIKWWNELETKWKLAFKQSIWGELSIEKPLTDDQLVDLLTRPALRFVGPQGTNPNMNFELDDLSGLIELEHIITLVLNYHKIKSISELSELTNLEALYINYNEITNLEGIQNLIKLKELVCNDNEITSLKPIKKINNLRFLNVANNHLVDLKGLSKKNRPSLKEIQCTPNEMLDWSAVTKFQIKTGIRCK